MSKFIFAALVVLFPMAAIVSGYLVLTSHLQGLEAVVYGWVLFLGGWISLPFFAAAAVEVAAPEAR